MSKGRMLPMMAFAVAMIATCIIGLVALFADIYQDGQKREQWMAEQHCKIDHYVPTAFEAVPIFRCDSGLYKYRDMPR